MLSDLLQKFVLFRWRTKWDWTKVPLIRCLLCYQIPINDNSKFPRKTQVFLFHYVFYLLINRFRSKKLSCTILLWWLNQCNAHKWTIVSNFSSTVPLFQLLDSFSMTFNCFLMLLDSFFSEIFLMDLFFLQLV